jgi:glycogen debranching enzyme
MLLLTVPISPGSNGRRSEKACNRYGSVLMTDATAEFFDGLARRGHDPRLENVGGSIRFDLAHDDRLDHWFVAIEDGDVSVSREEREADCVVRIDKPVFDRLVKGETSAVAAWLRNQVKIRGRFPLLRLFERLYPGPPGARDPRQVPRTKATPRQETPAAEEKKAAAIAGNLVSILESNTFVVSDSRGDMDPSPAFPTGFFAFDTRFLSTWHLSINGERLHALSVDDLQYFENRYFLVPGAPTHYVDAKVSVIRQHSVGGSFDEQLTVLNHDTKPVELRVRVDIDSDFADMFEIKDVRKKGKLYTRVEDGRLRLGYERDTFRRETLVSSTQPAQVDEQGMTFDIRIESHREWSTELHVATLGADGQDLRTTLQGQPGRPKPQMRQDLADWLARAPTLTCDSKTLTMTYERSLVDLAALRYRSLIAQGQAQPLGGLPWFMAALGRDSILTSFQALPFKPELAATTLLVLGTALGRNLDDFRDEEPGKIYHEVRLGELAAFEEQPHVLYYGAADSTPLWLVLLDEYERWTGDDTLVRRYEPEARRCLAWIDTYADALGNGYIWYQPRNRTTGLENQCW